MAKLTVEQITETIKKATRRTLLEASDTGVGAYAGKVDTLVKDTIDSLEKLAKEGEELVIDSPTHDYAVQERNAIVMARVGILKALKGRLIQVLEDLHRAV